MVKNGLNISTFRPVYHILKLVVAITLLILLLVGCKQSFDPYDTAKSYMDAWANLDFENMYLDLSKDSQENIGKDKFVDRYKTIFSAINLKSISLSPNEILNEEDMAYLPIDATFNTETVNSFDLRFTLPLILEDDQWKVVWSPSLIFPGLDEGDEVRITSQHAIRGDITNREDSPIVKEGEAYTVGAVPGKIPDKEAFAKALSPLLELKEEKILSELSKTWVTEDTLVPLRNFPLCISKEFQNELLSIDGVMMASNIVLDSRRYLDNELYSHIVGYAQRIGAEDLEGKTGYRENDFMGRQGIEASMEEHLHGISGYSLFIRDRYGEKKSIIAEVPPVNGDTVSLTLDPDLQEKVHKLIKGHVGSVTVLNGITGEVLAMVSYPDYNPNIFPSGVLPSQWTGLTEDPDKPFINRSTYALYPPGSTIKPFWAAAALEEGVISPDTVVAEAKNRSWTPSLNDWNAPPIVRTEHPKGSVNLDRALVWSDNIYFAWAALNMNYDSAQNYSDRLGISKAMPFDIPVSQSILKRQDTNWTKRLLATSFIGQGEVLVSPLQLAAMYTAFINQGDMILPQVIKEIRDYEGDILKGYEKKIWIPDAIPQNWVKTILSSLIGVVEDKTGTGRRIAIDGLTIAAKTGTAEKDNEGKEEIAWLTAFTPDEANPLVIAVALEVPAGEGDIKFDIVKEIFMDYYGIVLEEPETDEEED